jgi:hypothetical protein
MMKLTTMLSIVWGGFGVALVIPLFQKPVQTICHPRLQA